ncbi:MAG: GntR family transcriptional regulator [Microbacteriaceae bacterium]|nr:GntR family transcriptional regulator [Microbacteriaceae bacterium]
MATTPKYLQIRERLMERLTTMTAETALPQERELADEFEVSRATVRQALQSLSDDGLIYSIRGKGTFAAADRISKGDSLSSFSEDMRGRGLIPSSRVLTTEERESTPTVARALELEPGSPVYYVERLRLADGFPMALEELYLPANLFPKLLTLDLSSSIYGVMGERYRIKVTAARQRITALNVSGRTADLLGVPARSAALSVAREGIDARGRLVEHAVSVYRSDRYDFELSTRRL